jgi:cytochrome c-type biogenesis protein CcmE
MSRPRRVGLGLLVVGAALAYLIHAGVTQSAVYFVTPSELQADPVAGKAYRVGGVVVAGSLVLEPRTLDLAFTLTDGQAAIPVRYRGTPPDLFREGEGAVVEGQWLPEGHFKATLIMAKHSEEYRVDAGERRD